MDMGDAIHNLRSALDAVAWGMAHYKDAQPSLDTPPLRRCVLQGPWRGRYLTDINQLPFRKSIRSCL